MKSSLTASGSSGLQSASPGKSGEDGRENQGQRPPSQTLSAYDKADKVAALTKALDCIDKFRKNQESKDVPDQTELDDFATNLQEASHGASTKSNKSFHFGGGDAGVEATKCRQITEVLDKQQLSTALGGFCAAVSLNDGMVLQTTPTITDVLGFPKDMWHGRSFIGIVQLCFTSLQSCTSSGDCNKSIKKFAKAT